MCMYSSTDGFANDWHLVHLGSLAAGGAGLVISEATAVVPEGRISPQDLGIWKDEHVQELKRVTSFIKSQGAVPGIQLAHAGRKASTRRPWEGRGQAPESEGGWTHAVAPTAVPFSDLQLPHELTVAEIQGLYHAFANAAQRSLAAGFEVIELHGAHGYLGHQFLSPLSNHRTDEYGGSFENRTRFMREVVTEVRRVWPAELPLFVRISATDWTEGGWTPEESVQLSQGLFPLGADLIDCSSGGAVPTAPPNVAPGFQVPFAKAIRDAGVPSGAVGLITTPNQAEEIIANGSADLVFLARELLRDPHWPLRAAQVLGHEGLWPKQYERAQPFSL